jgi:cell division septation protein DedD
MPPRRKRSSHKGAKRKPAPSSSAGSTWRGFAAGFVAGLVSAFLGLYLYTNDPDINLGAGIKNLLENRSIPEQPSGTANPAQASNPKPVFDFYTVLPEYETVIDEKQYRRETRKEPAARKTNTAYVLQAASYSSFKEADKLKAKLALNGLTAKIEKVTVAGKGNFYRVRLGPYSSTGTMSDVDKRLKSLGIKPMRLKVRSGAG